MKQFLLLFAAFCCIPFAHSQNWLTTGNAGTNPSTNFLGTTDNQPLLFRINNTHAGKIDLSYGQTFLGYLAGNLSTTGANNTAIGYVSLNSNTTGYQNVSIGSYSLGSNSSGFRNVSVGINSLYYNTTGRDNAT